MREVRVSTYPFAAEIKDHVEGVDNGIVNSCRVVAGKTIFGTPKTSDSIAESNKNYVYSMWINLAHMLCTTIFDKWQASTT